MALAAYATEPDIPILRIPCRENSFYPVACDELTVSADSTSVSLIIPFVKMLIKH